MLVRFFNSDLLLFKEQRRVKKLRKVAGLPEYYPTETSLMASTQELRNINNLKSAASREEVAALMEATFSARRRAIVMESVSMENIHEDYPALFEETEVSTFSVFFFLFPSLNPAVRSSVIKGGR